MTVEHTSDQLSWSTNLIHANSR